jgi:hypothetical protein
MASRALHYRVVSGGFAGFRGQLCGRKGTSAVLLGRTGLFTSPCQGEGRFIRCYQESGGRNRQLGKVDLAMAQSLARRDDLEDLTAMYGFVVVDECHHVPAVTFERCVRQISVSKVARSDRDPVSPGRTTGLDRDVLRPNSIRRVEIRLSRKIASTRSHRAPDQPR